MLHVLMSVHLAVASSLVFLCADFFVVCIDFVSIIINHHSFIDVNFRSQMQLIE